MQNCPKTFKEYYILRKKFMLIRFNFGTFICKYLLRRLRFHKNGYEGLNSLSIFISHFLCCFMYISKKKKYVRGGEFI